MGYSSTVTVARFVLMYRGDKLLLPQGQFVLGRGRECDLPLDDEQVSRRHAILHVRPGEVELEDQGSRNGCFVNGEQVRGRRILRHGDKLLLGAQEIELLDEDGRLRRADETTISTAEQAPGYQAAQERMDRGTLSPRESDVLRLVARGHTLKEVAEHLSISVKTVETYRARIGEKLGVRSRSELVQFAIQAGLLTDDGKGPGGN